LSPGCWGSDIQNSRPSSATDRGGGPHNSDPLAGLVGGSWLLRDQAIWAIEGLFFGAAAKLIWGGSLVSLL
jgi:hypothetical protein